MFQDVTWGAQSGRISNSGRDEDWAALRGKYLASLTPNKFFMETRRMPISITKFTNISGNRVCVAAATLHISSRSKRLYTKNTCQVLPAYTFGHFWYCCCIEQATVPFASVNLLCKVPARANGICTSRANGNGRCLYVYKHSRSPWHFLHAPDRTRLIQIDGFWWVDCVGSQSWTFAQRYGMSG